MQGLRRTAGLGMAACLLLAGPVRADPSLEYAVKAAYLTKFVPFITWPDMPGPGSPIVLCLVGDDPFAGELDKDAQGAQVGGHPLTVRHLAEPDPACQVVFLSAADPDMASQVLDQLNGKPVVTVTDSGMAPRGLISFVIDANHVRFDIDAAQAEQDGLVISSKLLGLAHHVRTRGRP